MRCFACNEVLIPDLFKQEPLLYVNGEPDYSIGFDDHYQFDNAMWIGIFGGYGMFTDMMAGWPTNGNERYVENDDGEWVEDPEWEPTYKEKRMLPGRPDHEAVLCHDCAHEACDKLPWLKRLIDPFASHTHKTQWTEEHPNHFGWDYQRRNGGHGPAFPARPAEHEVPPAPWETDKT